MRRRKRLELTGVEHRLRDRVLGARLHLPVETPQLVVEIEMSRIDADADREARRLAERIAAEVEAAVHEADHVGQADRVDVEHRRRVRVRSHLRRIAGDEQHVAQAERRAAEKIGVHAEEVAVAAAVVEHGLDADALLQQHGDGDGAHAVLRARPVGNVHGVDARGLDRVHRLDHLVGVRSFRRRDLDRGHELAVRDLAPQCERFAERRRLVTGALLGRVLALDDDERAPRRQRTHRVGHDLDVLGRRSAAAAEELHAFVDEPLRVLGHVVGRGHVHLPAG